MAGQLIYNGSILPVEDYTIRHEYDGIDLLEFVLPDGVYVYNEDSIVETSHGQKYLVKIINGNKVSCDLDLDELKSSYGDYTNDSDVLSVTAEKAVKATGWVVYDNTSLTTRRTVEGSGTPLDAITKCEDTWGCTAVFDNKLRTITLVLPSNNEATTQFVTQQLNLRSLTVTGDSRSFYTAIRAKGKEGMTFASVNGGKDWVEDHSYSDRMVWGPEISDERFEVAENLLEYAKRTLSKYAVPEVSYECDVIDVAAEDPKYNFLNIKMHDCVWLLDTERNFRSKHHVVEHYEHPCNPSLNKVVLSTVAQRVQNKVSQLEQAVNNPQSGFSLRQAAAIASATDWLTNGKGYKVERRDADGNVIDTLYMDTNDTSTAKEVMRIGQSGIGFSHSGVGGPYTNSWTIDGKLSASSILTGTLDAATVSIINLIANHLTSESGSMKLDVWAAVFKMLWDENLRVRMYMVANDGGGLLQLFSGTVKEDGTQDSTTRYTYASPTSVGVGQKQDGTYAGEIHCGPIEFSSLNPRNDASSNCRWVYSATLNGYVMSTSTVLK